MSSPTTISIQKLARLVGTPKCPAIIDVRTDEDFAADPRLIPGSLRRPFARRGDVGAGVRRQTGGRRLPEGPEAQRGRRRLAPSRRRRGRRARRRVRRPGAEAGLPLVPRDRMPPRDAEGRTVWVTRARPKIDRIACPWLIRRFVDPAAVFLFVAPSEVAAVAERFGADALRHRGRVLEPPRRDLHVRHDGRGVRPRHRAAPPARDHRPRCRHRRVPTSRRRRRACLPSRSACRASIPTISSSSRPGWRSTTPSISGAATRSTRRTTGRRAKGPRP